MNAPETTTVAPEDTNAVIGHTVSIVAAALSGSTETSPEAITLLINSTYAALSALGQPSAVATVEEKREPAVSIRSSVKQDYIVCLEDGQKLKMLKRHLMTHYNLTPEQYRARWNLPADYPMVAPSYSEKRRDLAKQIGLGTKGRTAAPRRRTKKVEEAATA